MNNSVWLDSKVLFIEPETFRDIFVMCLENHALKIVFTLEEMWHLRDNRMTGNRFNLILVLEIAKTRKHYFVAWSTLYLNVAFLVDQ